MTEAPEICLAPPNETILDSQAVLDWLYFEDPGTQAWEALRQAGAWTWIATQAMHDELAHVLGRGCLRPGARSATQVLADYRARVNWVEPGVAPNPRLVCSDADDQKFLDLAVIRRTPWLVSRDKAVLKLRARAQRLHRITICPPALWLSLLAASSPPTGDPATISA